MESLFKDWKTNLASISLVILSGLSVQGYISPEQYTLGMSILAALGFAVAKDSGKGVK